MCRFLAYSGVPILLHELLYGPKNSLIKQSVSANEAEEPLNGDGFGIGWFNHDLDNEPAVYASIRPAWNDRNLESLTKKIKSGCFFAHVRAANVGEVSEANCHPFSFKNYIFMHNGNIEEFGVIKRFLRRKLSDDIYNWLRGSTDSEHIFALFLHNISQKYPNEPTPVQVAEVMKETVQEIEKMKTDYGLTSDNYINLAISTGKFIVSLRYVSKQKEYASTLYYSEGSRYECADGICRMRDLKDQEDQSVLIVSEKLTTVKKDWKEIPVDHFAIVDEKHHVTLIDFHKMNEVKKAA